MPIRPFLIDGLPRTGSTSLAKMLSCHRDVSCLVEPFHPIRYGGRYYREAQDEQSLKRTLELIWLRWTGIKHVWQPPDSWPFERRPELNDAILRFTPAVIAIERRNLLQRAVSTLISRKAKFWIGKKEDFIQALERTGLPEISEDELRKMIAVDRAALKRRRELLEGHPRATFTSYELLFGEQVTEIEQREEISRLLTFIGADPEAPASWTSVEWKMNADSAFAKWNTKEIYKRIPTARNIDSRLGSDENGWLFKETQFDRFKVDI